MDRFKLYLRTSALALLSSCMIALPVVGCTQTQVDTALNKIAAQIPIAESAATIVGTTIETIDPALIVPVNAALLIINPGLTELQTLITAYTSNPNASVLTQIQTLINSIVTNGSQALFAAAHITDAATQTRIIAVLNSLMAPLLLIDGFIQNIETKSTIQANAASRAVKLSMIDPYLDHKQLQQTAVANGTSYQAFYLQQTQQGY